MPYYRGDHYYRGDYYRGDFFGSLRSIVGGVARVAGAVLPGPAGMVASAAGRIITGGGGAAAQAAAQTPPPGTGLVPLGMAGGFSVTPVGSPVSLERFGQGAFPVQPGMFGPGTAVTGTGPQGQVVLGSSRGMSACGTKGYHLNKSGYYRRTPGGSVIYVEAHSACVKNRRMNPTNGRALRRALSRAYAFKKVAMRTIKLVDAGKRPKKFGGFKSRRKRA